MALDMLKLAEHILKTKTEDFEPSKFVGARRSKYLEAVMAERRPIFSAKDHCAQIGYVEADEAFDLSGRLRCTYNAATGNLHDTNTGKIVGHVSLAGNFVGSSWMADKLFGTPGNPTIVPNVLNITEIPDPGAPEQETEPVVVAETSENPEDALDRAIEMVRSALKEKPPPRQE